jgi:hypothetical protein
MSGLSSLRRFDLACCINSPRAAMAVIPGFVAHVQQAFLQSALK